MKKYFLALLFIFCIGSQVFAADWYFAGSASNTLFYIDTSSVRKDNDEAIMRVKAVNSDGSYSLGDMKLTHTPPTYSFSYAESYTADGTLKSIVSSYNMPVYLKNRAVIPPDSVSDYIWHRIWPD